MYNPHDITRKFEQAIAQYTGAPYAVTTTSCCMAITLALAYSRCHNTATPKNQRCTVIMPKRSYVGVPAAILNAGCGVEFEDRGWEGEYQLWPTRVWDSARRFTSGMYRLGAMQCLSLHWSKILGLSQGGVILH